jgi:hypothetical protein
MVMILAMLARHAAHANIVMQEAPVVFARKRKSQPLPKENLLPLKRNHR